MKAPDTKTILNITLVIAIIVIGKKIGEKFGLFDTKEDKTAEELAEGTTGNTSNLSPTAPIGLALNPNYWKSIVVKYTTATNRGKQIIKLLTINGTNPNKPTDFKALKTDNLWKLLIPPLAIKEISDDFKQIAKLKKLSFVEQTYAVLCIKIKDSKGVFKDDINNLNGIFTSLKSKAQISFLSNVYFNLYGEDLFTYMTTYTNTEEQTKIYKIIKNKPLA